MRADARRRAERIVREAEQTAREIVGEAHAARTRHEIVGSPEPRVRWPSWRWRRGDGDVCGDAGGLALQAAANATVVPDGWRPCSPT